MTHPVLDRLSKANPVKHVSTPDAHITVLLDGLATEAPRVESPKRRRLPKVAPLTAALTLALTGAAIAGVGATFLNYSPDSPDDPALVAPRASPSQGNVIPLTREQSSQRERDRRRAMPITDAGRYFSALGNGDGRRYRTLYADQNGIVAARATDREVCVRYRSGQQADPTETCLATATARTRGAYVFTQCDKTAAHPQHRVIAGIAPDGVDAVQGGRRGAPQVSAPVDGNGFVLVTDQPIDTIRVGDSRQTIGPIIC